MTRRGVALLLVLALLAIAATAATAVLRVGIADRLDRAWASDAAAADDLLAASEAAALAWLARHAERTVLPPEATQPAVLILDDRLSIAGLDARITLAAWDQCGMLPPELVLREPALRRLLPDHAAAPATPLRRSRGLDAARTPARVFPRWDDDAPAVGALLATHNPLTEQEIEEVQLPLPSINVNTAPMPLIESAFAAAGLSGVEQVEEARRAGRKASLNGLRVGGAAGFRLSGTSSVWAVRADAVVGRARRSWWTVYANAGGQWRVVQRLVIDE